MTEVWADVAGFEGLYQISNQGRVARVTDGFRVRRPGPHPGGYHIISLYGSQKRRRSRLIHRLVAKAFIPNPLNHPEVNHINGDRTDNRAENLEWVDRKGNVRHAINSGRWRPRDCGHWVCATPVSAGAVGLMFRSYCKAERELSPGSRNTGAVSWAVKHGRPTYGFSWAKVSA